MKFKLDNLTIIIDLTFLDLVEEYFLNEQKEKCMKQLVLHPAAKKTYLHAVNLRMIDETIEKFWINILEEEKEKGEKHLHRIKECKTYIEKEKEEVEKALIELQEYLPENKSLAVTLYANIGYDIGIVSDGDALINFGSGLYHKDKRELIYYAMHELHHAVYSRYHPLFSLRSPKTKKNIVYFTKYGTHLEGFATYVPFAKRKREEGFTVNF